MHPISEILAVWYQQNKRDLPWRNTQNPYFIWLSEIILQQTRVEQGKPYYYAFIEKYPTISELANATENDVLKTWEGLGYYSRARNLHTTAKYIFFQLNSVFPSNYEGLLKLKGIGPYTAAAISSFAYNENKAVVDGNVFRVLSRIFGIEENIADTKNRKIFDSLATELLPNGKSALHNQAIMEFGALQCSPIPKCAICPMQRNCFAFQNNKQNTLPVKINKTKVKTVYFYYLVIENKKGIQLQKRTGSTIWNGLFDFPLLESETPLEMYEIKANLAKRLTFFEVENQSKEYKHLLSHRKILATFYRVKTTDKLTENYSIEAIKSLPKPVLIINYLNDYIF
jgi:A/G-specific adenine glycosylase